MPRLEVAARKVYKNSRGGPCGKWAVGEMVLTVDRRGRVLIPANIRRKLGIRGAVKARVEEGKLVLIPMEDPLLLLEKIVVKGTSDVEAQIRELRRAAEEALVEEASHARGN